MWNHSYNSGDKICKFWSSGNCLKGNSCNFKHIGPQGKQFTQTNSNQIHSNQTNFNSKNFGNKGNRFYPLNQEQNQQEKQPSQTKNLTFDEIKYDIF